MEHIKATTYTEKAAPADKAPYESVQLEVIRLDGKDIITASGRNPFDAEDEEL